MKKTGFFLLGLLLILGCNSDDVDVDPDMDNDPPISLCEGLYPCNNFTLVSHIPLTTFDAVSGNDSWGWTDPETNAEYVLMGVDNGTVFIDISTPETPVYLGKLPTATVSILWRDVKVYNNHAFIVSEAPDHGMQVFDLTRLRSVATPPETFTADAHYTEFGDAHNIAIHEDSGFAYAVGTEMYGGGPHFIDISDPLNPVPAGGYAADGYTHDAQIVTYNGPDIDHVGKEIFIGSNLDEVVIVDVSDKENPIKLGAVSYPDYAYTHQGWLTEDHTYFILGDEGDETGNGFNTRTLIFDFSDLDQPLYYESYLGPTPAIDHNGYVKGSLFYLANYSAGFRLIDISSIDNFNEIGYFDTYPDNDTPSFNGVWNVYPFFESGYIVLSDRDSGLFVIQHD